MMLPTNPDVSSVSAFFPCYNDAMSIAKMVRDVHGALITRVKDFEIIVVNDGSKDDSLTVLAHLADEISQLRIVNHEVNRGYGGALQSGFAAAQKQWIFYTDGDAQYDAAEIVRCIDAVTPTTDVVQGWKVGRGDSWYRKVIGRTYHHVVKRLFTLSVRDTDCDFRLIRHSLVDSVELNSTSGVICVEMMRKFEKANARFVEVPVSHYFRPHGKSQFFRLPAIAGSARQLFDLWFKLVVRRKG
jgi:glycosyltransferase involved in cell wall biosynthesis